MSEREQTRITARRKELDTRRKKAERQLAHIRVDYEHLYTDCKHPNASSGYCMNEPSSRCPDCGWEL